MGLKNQGFSKPQISSGFTLIELMITVAIVGVLAALALPAYQDYTIRSQVVEGLSLASGSKSLVAEYYASKGSLPTDSASVSYDSQSGKYVANTTIQNGEILAYFGNAANQNITGSYIKLVPDDSGNNLVWSCESNIVRKYLPSSCVVNSAGNGAGGSTGGNTGGSPGNGNGGTGNTGGDNSGGSTDPGTGTNPPDTTSGKTLTPEQSSKYPEVAAAYQRYFDSAGQVSQYNQQASTLQSQADAAAASGDNNLANQLRGQAQNASQQANNFSTQMQQALTQYSQAINVYEGRNNGTLPGDFPKAPTI